MRFLRRFSGPPMQSPSRLHGDGNWEERKTRKRASVTVPLTATLARFLVLRSSSDFRGKERLLAAYSPRGSFLPSNPHEQVTYATGVDRW